MSGHAQNSKQNVQSTMETLEEVKNNTRVDCNMTYVDGLIVNCTKELETVKNDCQKLEKLLKVVRPLRKYLKERRFLARSIQGM